MQKTSQKLTVLVEALLYIAYNSAMQPLGGKKLADILDVPPRYLELLLQSLVKASILRSVRGPRGGYMLARERSAIYMHDVVCAVEQDKPDKNRVFSLSNITKKIDETATYTNSTALHVDRKMKCYTRPSVAQDALVKPLFEQGYAAYLDALSTITLEDLCIKTHRLNLTHVFILKKPDAFDRLDFSI